MPFYEAAAPVAVVIAAFVLLREFVGPKVVWARWLILAFTLAVVVRYLPWRFTETVMSRDILSLDGAWIWFLFAVECVFIADLLKILLVRCRFADRTADGKGRTSALLPSMRAASLEKLPFHFFFLSLNVNVNVDVANFCDVNC